MSMRAARACVAAVRLPFTLAVPLRSRRPPRGLRPQKRRVWTVGVLRPRLLALASSLGEASSLPSAPAAELPLKAAPIVETIRLLTRLEAERQELAEQRSAEADVELQQLYDAEIRAADMRLSSGSALLEQELLLMLGWARDESLDAGSLSDAFAGGEAPDNDSRDVVLEVTHGVGGQEAAIFAGELLDMYERLAAAHAWEFEVEHIAQLDGGGVQAATARISGPGDEDRAPFGWLRYESGVHRVQRIPTTDRKNRMQTSSAAVVVLPMAVESDLELAPSDLRLEVSKKSSGPGGQSVNAAHQAIRATHIPTGLSVFCASSQSQLENRRRSIEMLRTRLLAQREAARGEFERSERRGQRGTGDRSEKIRTYNFQRDEVVDHLLGKAGSTSSAGDVLFGDGLESLLAAHRAKARTERLSQAVAILEAVTSSPSPTSRSAGSGQPLGTRAGV